MESDKKPDETGAGSTGQSAPQDALTKTNEELAAEAPAVEADANAEQVKKTSGFKAFLKRFNLYLLLFLLLVVLGSAVSIVSYLNSKKAPKVPSIASQDLTADTLKQLANSDATVGDSGQTLTVQGNAIFSGQVLVRSDLNVAGTIKLGGELNIPKLTVSGSSNLNDVQANSLQVASGSTFQGTVTVQKDLNVGGAASFSGPVTAGQLTVSRLIMSGNAVLQIPNHIGFSGASPGRSLNAAPLGAGGGASLNGSDTTGTINVNSGSGTSAGCFITITFNRAFSASPHVIVSPVGNAAGQMQYYVNRTNTSFTLCTANAAPANQVFAFDYFVTG